MAEAIFRRPAWRQNNRAFYLSIGGLLCAIGFLELYLGSLQFFINATLSFENIGIGAPLIALGFAMIYSAFQENTIQKYFIDLTIWLDALLTNRESPPLSGIRDNSTELSKLNGEVTSLSKKIRGLEGRIQVLFTDSNSLVLSGVDTTNTELKKLREEELSKLRKEFSKISKRVKKIEDWNN